MLHLSASEKMQMDEGVLAKDSALFVLKQCTGKKELSLKAGYGLGV